jgi:hypothetical protein
MAMTAGSVAIAVDADGDVSYTGSGLARGLAEQLLPAIMAAMDELMAPRADWPGDNSSLRTFMSVQIAKTLVTPFSNAIAIAVVAHITANAKAHVTTEILGRTPNPNNPNTNILAPAAPVDVPIV